MGTPMIEVKGVSMRFNMAKEKVDSLKEWVIRKMNGSMHFEEFYALKDVSLTVEAGDVYGMVGLNGSGKSTLLKVISGVMKPSNGECHVYGTVAPLIELGAGFDMELTGQENVFLNGAVLGMEEQYVKDNYEAIVEFAELQDFMNVPVKNYSSGMLARLAFSVATVMKPDILICDEILSVGDFLFREKSEKRMLELMSGGTTVIIVSHEIAQIERLCNKAVWLNKGRVVAQGDCMGVCNDYKENAHRIEQETTGAQ